MGFRQFGQLEIVGGEEAEGFVFAAGVRRWRVRGRGRRRWRCRVRPRPRGRGIGRWRGEGCRRFLPHFYHEGGAVGGEVVGGTDAGEDLIDGADLGGIGRHEAAGVRHEDDVGDLAHVGGFTRPCWGRSGA